ncbi:MAG: hypothetical protein HKN76_05620 [Saprospiraceae bacterium]|nr:hypothetical protein [Saprospiraceae bacterium]
MNLLSFMILFTASLLSGQLLHDFHLSKTEVHYNEENESLEISLHIFIDDLELAMIQSGMENPNFSTSKEHIKADSLLGAYLTHHFSVIVDGQKVVFDFLGKEYGEDLTAFWCYLEGQNITSPKKIKLQNRLLLDLFDDQKNVVAFTSAKKKEFMLFDHKKQEATINL